MTQARRAWRWGAGDASSGETSGTVAFGGRGVLASGRSGRGASHGALCHRADGAGGGWRHAVDGVSVKLRGGDRVQVREPGMPLHGREGVVIARRTEAQDSYLMVLLDGETASLRFGDAVLVRLDSSPHMVAGE